MTYNLDEFLKAIRAGVDYGPVKFRIRWQSADGRFALVTRPGHRTWASIGATRYAQTEHWLFDLAKIPHANARGFSLYTLCKVAEIEGRLTPRHLHILKAKIGIKPTCPECGASNPEDGRIAGGMKCGQCAYGR